MIGWLRRLLYGPVDDLLATHKEMARQLAAANHKLNYIIRRSKMWDDILKALDEANAKVTALETVEASAIALLGSIKKALDDALALGKAEQVAQAIKAISDKLGVDTVALAKAVTDNTPAAPPTDVGGGEAPPVTPPAP